MKIGILHERNSGFFPRFYRDLSEAISLSGNDWVLLTPNSGANKRNPLPKQRLYGARWNWFVHFNLYKLIGLQDIFIIFNSLSYLGVTKRKGGCGSYAYCEFMDVQSPIAVLVSASKEYSCGMDDA